MPYGTVEFISEFLIHAQPLRVECPKERKFSYLCRELPFPVEPPSPSLSASGGWPGPCSPSALPNGTPVLADGFPDFDWPLFLEDISALFPQFLLIATFSPVAPRREFFFTFTGDVVPG